LRFRGAACFRGRRRRAGHGVHLPRGKLVRALKAETNLVSTQSAKPGAEPQVTTLNVKARRR